MDLQITKKQFIIITVLIIVITVVMVIIVVSGKKNNVVNDDIPITDNGTASKSENIKKTTTSSSEDIEQDITDDEVDIPITIQGTVLSSIANEIDATSIFGEMFEPTAEEIDDYMDIDVSLFDEYIIKMSTSKFKSELYMIFKPSSNNETKAMSQIKNFLINYENSWSSLDYKQYDIVSTRKAVKRNGYLIYVVSSNNEEVLNIVRKHI